VSNDIKTNFEKEVYCKYFSLVKSVCRKRLIDKSQLNDAIQSTFLLYVKEEDRIKSELSSWFYWSSLNVCKAINKRTKIEFRNVEIQDSDLEENLAESNIEFEKAFELISKSKKELLLMRFYDELSYKEIGNKIKCTEDTARRRVIKITSYLQSRLTKKEILASALFAILIPNKKLIASELNSKAFVLQNTAIQQSIVKGVLKMYLFTKLKIVIVLLFTVVFTTFGISQELMSDKIEKNTKENNIKKKLVSLSRDYKNNTAEKKVTKTITLKDQVIIKGLQYLADIQHKNGSWPVKGNGVGINSIVLLSFMAHGNSSINGRFSQNVKVGLEWILSQIKEDGSPKNTAGIPSMYSHAFAALCLSEALLKDNDTSLINKKYKNAIRYIITSQGKFGSWGYHSGKDGSSFGTSIQLIALKSAISQGIDIDKNVLKNAKDILKSRLNLKHQKFGYLSSKNYLNSALGSHTSSSCAFQLLLKKDSKASERVEMIPFVVLSLKSIATIKKAEETFLLFGAISTYLVNDIYYDEWCKFMIPNIIKNQNQNGSFGDIYQSAMAILSLASPDNIFSFITESRNNSFLKVEVTGVPYSIKAKNDVGKKIEMLPMDSRHVER